MAYTAPLGANQRLQLQPQLVPSKKEYFQSEDFSTSFNTERILRKLYEVLNKLLVLTFLLIYRNSSILGNKEIFFVYNIFKLPFTLVAHVIQIFFSDILKIDPHCGPISPLPSPVSSFFLSQVLVLSMPFVLLSSSQFLLPSRPGGYICMNIVLQGIKQYF